MVYQSETDVESQAELIQLEEDLEALQYATNAESPSGTVLDSQILSAMSSLRNASSTGITAAWPPRPPTTASWFCGGSTCSPRRPMPP